METNKLSMTLDFEFEGETEITKEMEYDIMQNVLEGLCHTAYTSAITPNDTDLSTERIVATSEFACMEIDIQDGKARIL